MTDEACALLLTEIRKLCERIDVAAKKWDARPLQAETKEAIFDPTFLDYADVEITLSTPGVGDPVNIRAKSTFNLGECKVAAAIDGATLKESSPLPFPRPLKMYFNAGHDNEIRLSAGAMSSPQLLMLNGVGLANHLSSFGITEVGSYIEGTSGSNWGIRQSGSGDGHWPHNFDMFSPLTGELAPVPPKQRMLEAITRAPEGLSQLNDTSFRGGLTVEKILGPLSTSHLKPLSINDIAPNQTSAVGAFHSVFSGTTSINCSTKCSNSNDERFSLTFSEPANFTPTGSVPASADTMVSTVRRTLPMACFP